MMYRHRPSAFAFIRCGPDLFIATSRRNGEELNPPGGKIDPGDDDALETAIREVREETGIRLRRSEIRPHAAKGTSYAIWWSNTCSVGDGWCDHDLA